jgi:hypothetical protein
MNRSKQHLYSITSSAVARNCGCFSMINYLNELPLFRDEVLPRLERLGVRAAHK